MPFYKFEWSPNGETLAARFGDYQIALWSMRDTEEPTVINVGVENPQVLAWSNDGKRLALCCEEGECNIEIIDVESDLGPGQLRDNFVFGVEALIWSPDDKFLISASGSGDIYSWNVEEQSIHEAFRGHDLAVHDLAWQPGGNVLASASEDQTVLLWDIEDGVDVGIVDVIEVQHGPVRSLAWLNDGDLLAFGSEDQTIGIWSSSAGRIQVLLEGNSGSAESLAFSQDGKLLFSKSDNGPVRMWQCETWDTVEIPSDMIPESWSPHIAFHPQLSLFAVTANSGRHISIFEIITESIIPLAETRTIQHSSAKIVLVGESNVGKSCLALRLAEDRYEEQGTTHGMKLWRVPADKFSGGSGQAPNEQREIILWDLGGQDEYRLVHQLFLHDTTLALILMDPTRGRTAFQEVESWNLSLEKQLRGRIAVKLLVGTKMDESSPTVDTLRINQLVEKCGFASYIETSAKTTMGIPELTQAIADSLDWDTITMTRRPALSQTIRDQVQVFRDAGDIIVFASDFEELVRANYPYSFSKRDFELVLDQLAIQGIIAQTQLNSDERALILRVEEVERYAGSIIVAARSNPRGIATIEERQVASPNFDYPGLGSSRLPRIQERIVLECVVQLLLEHWVCLKHEGLLIFPSLFHPTESEPKGPIPHTVSLYYDFSGAIDSVYAALVSSLAISGRFGRLRLWDDRAEFERSPGELCGVDKIERESGFAHLDVYFDLRTGDDTRKLFISFIEDHLRRVGVTIYEYLSIACKCGNSISEEIVRERISLGHGDIGCPRCDERIKISEGAKRSRERDASLLQRTWALRTTTIEKTGVQITDTKRTMFAQADETKPDQEPIRILHLSDLHISRNANIDSILQPLVADIRSKNLSKNNFALSREGFMIERMSVDEA